MKKIIIIGAGASGLAASISAGLEGADVTMLESGKRAGKKLLSTGNGRCNYTNLSISPEALAARNRPENADNPDLFNDIAKTCYHSSDSAFVNTVISSFHSEDAISWFRHIGIYPALRDELVYPRSMQAAAVLDALRFRSEETGAKLACDSKVISIEKPGKSKSGSGGFIVKTDKAAYSSDAVILCAGGKAMPSTGSDGSGYSLCKKLGHTIVPIVPALVPLRCAGLPFPMLAGVRARAAAKAYRGKDLIASDEGEIQFTSYGLSGIPVMQISSAVSRSISEGIKCTIELDLLPDIDGKELYDLLSLRRTDFPGRECSQLFLGLLPRKLAEALLKACDVPLHQQIGTIADSSLWTLVRMAKHFRSEAIDTAGWEHAQVTSGGVALSEVNPHTMESLICPGLYITGELLDVDGICGGYNLHWAWATGVTAGKSASRS